jgi:Fe-S-cluster-containing dehydrogenase component/formate-dependent nitrite reductase membrane component NrfD
MRYGFVIDQDRCIGCHACTVACKEEHSVPVGVFRTWVKYIEKGAFPDTSRHFGVMRCNHCDAAPCIEICPTTALFKRDNGVVDFDNERCIGCKSCMQACPYDALYIDPASNTAAKCNFCAHRLELNLEPACVIVCPTQAILAGDLDDPQSQVSRTIATQKVTSRKPAKGTQPKLYYVGIDGDLLQPTAPAAQSSYLWADRRPSETEPAAPSPEMTPGRAREVYNVAHPAPWGWKIATYLFTKSIAAGVIMVAALLLALGGESHSRLLNVASPLTALVFVGITSVLLIVDLKRPERFYYLLTKSNFKSWVVIGAYVLIAYGAFAFLWLVFGLFGATPPAWLALIAALLGIAAAGYSGFLFAQAKGRDLWQSALFPWHLLVQAMVAGAAALLLAAVAGESTEPVLRAIQAILLVALAVALVMTLTELYGAAGSEEAEIAVALLRRGALSRRFWGVAVGIGVILPALLIALGRDAGATNLAAGASALLGLWMYETLWVKAGQAAPLS